CTHSSDKETIHRALTRTEARGKATLLHHDIHPATAAALPVILHELKIRGFKIVHVVQAGPSHPKTATTPEQWMLSRAEARSFWPNVVVANLNLPDPVLPVPNPRNFGIVDAVGTVALASLVPVVEKPRAVDGGPTPP